MMVALCLEAACLARLSAASRADCGRLSEPTVRWCADRRRPRLAEGLVQGDLELPETAPDEEEEQQPPWPPAAPSAALRPSPGGPPVRWTLERLHLAEHPPRFPRLYFEFASDELVRDSKPRVAEVVALLRRFPALCIRVEGHAHPSAPPPLGMAVAQARAASTRRELLRRLQRDPGPRCKAGNPWADEDPDEGVYEPGGYNEGRGRLNTEFYQPRLLGRRLQGIGLWGRDPQLRNANFLAELAMEDGDAEAKFRRVDFTVLCLDP